MATLFSPITVRGVSCRNRLVVSPMCQYSSDDGFASDWHLVHLGSRAVGGAAIVFTEATAVEPRGRISPQDLGIWKDAHVPMLKRITDFIKSQGAVPAIQLAHAGRKASTAAPWKGGAYVTLDEGGWLPVAPSAIPFFPKDPKPTELSAEEIAVITQAFAQAAKRALAAGFEIIELHAAHGYLLHEFLSPLSNKRPDAYGGTLENRMRAPLEVIQALRRVMPERLPLWVRISATDWMEGGWDVDQSVIFAQQAKQEGVDVIDCSSGALVPDAKIPAAPGFQVPFAEKIKQGAHILTGAVGLITQPQQAEAILAAGQADFILMAREFLRDPYATIHAAKTFNTKIQPPVQYGRAL